MRYLIPSLLVLTALLGHPAESALSAPLTDPYEVLERHYEALGGVERLLAEETSYYESTMTTAGLEGTVRHWFQRPGRYRNEFDLGDRIDISGDNGQTAWSLDANGKLTIQREERALRLRELSLRMQRFEHLDRNSPVFSHTFEGTEPVDGVECYVVRTANTLDDAITLRYFDTQTFLERKHTSLRGERGSHTLYLDHRETDGVTRAHRIEVVTFPVEQPRTIEIEKYLVNIEIDESLFEPPTGGTKDFAFTGGAESTVVKFELIDTHIYVPVTVDCDRRLWILDSGAGMTLIDTEYARELGLELTGADQAAGAGQLMDVSFVTLPPLSVPGVEFTEQKLAAIPIAGLFRQGSDEEIGGLLGYDFLSRFVTRIDYADSTLTLYDPEAFSYDGEGTVVDAALWGNVLTVPASVSGILEGSWMLDVGADIVCLTYPFAEAQGFLDREGLEVVAMGGGGAFDATVSRLQRVEFAGHVFENAPALVPATSVVGALGMHDFDGILGYDTFRHLVLYLDYARQKVIVERGRDYGTEVPLDRSGLTLWRSEAGEVEVFHVSPRTPADEAGFQKGDVVVAINGIGAGALKGLPEIRDLLEAGVGTTYEFRILRGGESIDLEITLRDIL